MEDIPRILRFHKILTGLPKRINFFPSLTPHVHTRTHTHAHPHTRTYTQTHTHTHSRTHTHTYAIFTTLTTSTYYRSSWFTMSLRWKTCRNRGEKLSHTPPDKETLNRAGGIHALYSWGKATGAQLHSLGY